MCVDSDPDTERGARASRHRQGSKQRNLEGTTLPWATSFFLIALGYLNRSTASVKSTECAFADMRLLASRFDQSAP